MILTCRQLVEKVTEARQGRLSAGDRVGWAAHLAWCGDCRLYVEQMDETVLALRSARPTSQSARARVLALFHQRRP